MIELIPPNALWVYSLIFQYSSLDQVEQVLESWTVEENNYFGRLCLKIMLAIPPDVKIGLGLAIVRRDLVKVEPIIECYFRRHPEVRGFIDKFNRLIAD